MPANTKMAAGVVMKPIFSIPKKSATRVIKIHFSIWAGLAGRLVPAKCKLAMQNTFNYI